MEARLKTTWIATETKRRLDEGIRYVWHEGGTRSSKTYNVAAAVIAYAWETGTLASVVRISLPVIRKSVLRDYIDVCSSLGIYSDAMHNKTEQILRLPGGGAVEFFGVDDEQKVKGSKRRTLHMNEADEISDAKRRELWLRTTGTVIVDHNPVPDDDHWIVQKLEPAIARGECVRYHSTYRDNPFLEAATVREIEAMQYDDPYGWRVYGLGERGTHEAAVFTDVALGAFSPAGETVYGVDFGFKDPFVVAEWGWRDSDPPRQPRPALYLRPHVYARHMTTGEVIEEMRRLSLSKTKPMFCDSAEPDRILELKQAGYDARAVVKRQGAREAGYDWLKRHRIVVDADADNAEVARRELHRTRYKQKPGTDRYTDQVVDADDHVADTARYGAFERWGPAVDELVGASQMYI